MLVCKTHGVTLQIGAKGERRYRTNTLGLPSCALLLAPPSGPGQAPVPDAGGRPSRKLCAVEQLGGAPPEHPGSQGEQDQHKAR